MELYTTVNYESYRMSEKEHRHFEKIAIIVGMLKKSKRYTDQEYKTDKKHNQSQYVMVDYYNAVMAKIKINKLGVNGAEFNPYSTTASDSDIPWSVLQERQKNNTEWLKDKASLGGNLFAPIIYL